MALTTSMRTQPDAPLVGQVGLAPNHGLLNFDGALDGLNDAGKLGQEPVAHELHDASLALRDFRLHQLFTEGLQAIERSCLVLAHQAAITDHVGCKYGGQLALHTFFAHGAPLSWNAEEVAV